MPPAYRQEGIEAELGDRVWIMVAISAGVLLNGGLNGGGHETTLAAIKTYGQSLPAPIDRPLTEVRPRTQAKGTGRPLPRGHSVRVPLQ
jgi:hypothetical protein